MLTENNRLAMRGKISKDLAIWLAGSEWWKDMEPRDVAEAQLNQDILCMDWVDFVTAVQTALGRGVFTHEFTNPQALLDELNGIKQTPSHEEVVSLLVDAVGPERIVLVKVTHRDE